MMPRFLLLRFLPLLCLAAAIVLLSGCESISRTYNNYFGSAPVAKPAELPVIKTTATLKLLWQGSVGPAEKDVFYPAVSGGVVYAVGAAGSVTGFEAASGKQAARVETGQRVSGGVGVGGDMVMLGTGKGEVLAYERGGKALWKAQLAGEVLAPPQMQDGVVVARAGDGRIYGLDAATGKQRWLYQRATPPLSVRTHTGVVVSRGAVFVGFPGGRLVALVLGNGNIGWDSIVAMPRGTTELERVSDITSLPAVDGPQVCAVAYQGRVACLDASRGSVQWARDASSVAGLALDARNVYVTDEKNAVAAFDRAGGASLWRQDRLVNRRVSGPLAIGRYVVVGDVEGYVHVISRDDGTFAARIATDGSPISAAPAAIDSNSFVVQTRNGGVYAFTIQ